MFRLNKCKKKGIGMVEVVCSMAIFFLLSSFILSIKINNLKLNSYNRQVNEYVEFLDSLKEDIYYNYNYDDIKVMESKNLVIINKENISLESLKIEGAKNIFTSEEIKHRPYLIMSIEDDKEVLKINLELYVNIQNHNKVMRAVCFKGEY
ncbi:hypothetical protein [Clostridium ganghwense]|uniref:Type II secretion system protein n=1 Tax=Clostridium ganghwense TaxID=312089 RepID=A0ABT4CMS3_9CLOT|nr:hypothetical protein [Clostridium ganghwense]MCY6370332.1 hypothetical protein [Clostridium ganghwense]